MDIKGHNDRGTALFTGAHVHGSDIDLLFCKYLGNICKKTDPVVCKNLDFCGILLCTGRIFCYLPLSIDQPSSFIFRKVDHIDTVCTVDGNASSSGNKTNDLITRYRITASGETHCQIMKSFDHDPALIFTDCSFAASSVSISNTV